MTITAHITAIRRQWGRRLLILGHYYQSDDVLQHADVQGDSLELSRRAAAAREAERIVFCGVYFMAESADILTEPAQTVYMPDSRAGCPMADMAALREVQQAWTVLTQATGSGWLPVVYVNSSAAIKAFCGAQGGSTCTSSNAVKVLQWAWGQGKRILFLPDQHLGMNTAHDLGVPDEAVVLYDPAQSAGGLSREALAQSRLVVWKGYCAIHTVFQTADVERVRRSRPEAKIIVHPETPAAVVRLAEAHGSTSQIIRYVEAAPAGSAVAVGTEFHLVERLARQHQGRVHVFPLRRSVCPNMALTTEAKLLQVLEHWPVANEIHVPPDIQAQARLALTRMLEL